MGALCSAGCEGKGMGSALHPLTTSYTFQRPYSHQHPTTGCTRPAGGGRVGGSCGGGSCPEGAAATGGTLRGLGGTAAGWGGQSDTDNEIIPWEGLSDIANSHKPQVHSLHLRALSGHGGASARTQITRRGRPCGQYQYGKRRGGRERTRLEWRWRRR